MTREAWKALTESGAVAHAVFNELYDAHYVTVLRFIERRVETRDVAQEIAAEVFMVLWRKLDPAIPFELPWLYKVARHHIANHYRKLSRRAAAEQQLRMLADQAEAIAGTADDDLRQAVVDALTRLPARQREIVLLTYWEGLSAAEVGVLLDMRDAAVWAALSRARTALRAALSTPAKMTEGGAR